MSHWILWIHDWAPQQRFSYISIIYLWWTSSWVTTSKCLWHQGSSFETQGCGRLLWINVSVLYAVCLQKALESLVYSTCLVASARGKFTIGCLEPMFFSRLMLPSAYDYICIVLHHLIWIILCDLTWSYIILHHLALSYYVKTSWTCYIILHDVASYISLHLHVFVLAQISFNLPFFCASRQWAGEPSLWRLGWFLQPGVHHGEGEQAAYDAYDAYGYRSKFTLW